MFQKSAQERDTLTRRVKANLRQAEEITSSLRKVNTRLLVAGVASSAVSTLVAGITAAQGPIVWEGTAGWRLACIVAALFGFVSTLSIGLNQRLRINHRLSKGIQCVGELKSLDVTIAAGSRDREEIVEEYEEIVKAYPEFID